MAGLGGAPLLGSYRASKAAVLRLTETAAIEVRAAGVRVDAVCPSFINTEMVERPTVGGRSISSEADGRRPEHQL